MVLEKILLEIRYTVAIAIHLNKHFRDGLWAFIVVLKIQVA